MSVVSQLPRWLQRPAERLGLRSFDRVTEVQLQGRFITDDLLDQLAALRSLKKLSLYKTTDVSHAAIERLRRELPDCEIIVGQPFEPLPVSATGSAAPAALWPIPPAVNNAAAKFNLNSD